MLQLKRSLMSPLEIPNTGNDISSMQAIKEIRMKMILLFL